jgi:hypothetical protein
MVALDRDHLVLKRWFSSGRNSPAYVENVCAMEAARACYDQPHPGRSDDMPAALCGAGLDPQATHANYFLPLIIFGTRSGISRARNPSGPTRFPSRAPASP